MKANIVLFEKIPLLVNMINIFTVNCMEYQSSKAQFFLNGKNKYIPQNEKKKDVALSEIIYCTTVGNFTIK